MKGSVKELIAILMVIVSIGAAAQEFAPVGAKWHYTLSDEYWPVNFPIYNFSAATVEAKHDTLIGAVTATVLNVTNNDSCNPLRNRLLVYEQAKKVFVKDELHPDFYLLYDFAATNGESWNIPGYHELGDSITITVDSVSLGIYGNDTLKEMFVSISTNGVYDTPESLYSTIDLNENKIVERMGHLFNFFPWWGGLCHKPRAIKLRCYSDSTISWHSSPDFQNNCDTIYSHNTSVTETSVTGFSLYPNPAQTILFVTFFGGAADRTINIYDLSGKLHKTIKTTKPATEICLAKISAGLYILRILEDKKTSQIKFLKVN